LWIPACGCITHLSTENNPKEGKTQGKAKVISKNNAKIPNYHDSFKVKSPKAKGKKPGQKFKGKSSKE